MHYFADEAIVVPGTHYIEFNGATQSSKISLSPLIESGNESLTRQQIDLINQIMQQTRVDSDLTVVRSHNTLQRPRTWNLQVMSTQHVFLEHLKKHGDINRFGRFVRSGNCYHQSCFMWLYVYIQYIHVRGPSKKSESVAKHSGKFTMRWFHSALTFITCELENICQMIIFDSY